jgi:hypothetical protein
MTNLQKLTNAQQEYKAGLINFNNGLIAEWELDLLKSKISSAQLDVWAE